MAAEDSLNTGDTASAVSPLLLTEQGRGAAAADARIASHGARPKYRVVDRLSAPAPSAAGSSAVGEVGGGLSQVPTGSPSVNPLGWSAPGSVWATTGSAPATARPATASTARNAPIHRLAPGPRARTATPLGGPVPAVPTRVGRADPP